MHWFCGFSTVKDFTGFPQPVMGRNIWEASTPLWVCGFWQESQLIQVTEGHVRLTLIGNCLASHEKIVIAFRNAVLKGDYNELTTLGGSYNTIIHDEVGIHIFTDIAGLKPVYYALYKNYIVYSSCSIALNELTGAKVSHNWLATNLIFPGIRDLVRSQSPFEGVKSVPPGHVLQIFRENLICKKYWTEPHGNEDFLEVAQKLRERLINAVEARACLYKSITSDLSGGLDSTSLSLLAARKLATQERKLHTITVKNTSSNDNEDFTWAQHAISFYSNIHPIIIDNYEFSSPFSDLEKIPLIDEPSEVVISISKFRRMMEIVREQNSRLHLNGEGGDAVLSGSKTYLIDLFRRAQFKTFIKHAYGWAKLFRCSPVSIINGTIKFSSISYRNWLSQQAKRLIEQTEGKNSILEIFLGWSSPAKGINLYTKEALYLVASELSKYATVATSFSGGQGQHCSICDIHRIADRARGLQQIAEEYEVNLEFPYLDPLVVDACLQTKLEERTTPFRYKPLLYEALHNDLPNSVLNRTNKVSYIADIYTGIKKNLDNLNELFINSKLSNIGLINRQEIDSTLMKLSIGLPSNFEQFCTIVTTELWLRKVLEDNYNNFWVKQ
jgi:asparagine synthase (glutamine-hydrolysing)